MARERSGGKDYQEVMYEGYGPGGVAVFVEALTDNTNRTVAALRHILSKAGGSLGKPGSVGYLFERKGILEIPVAQLDELTLFETVVEAGADDVERANDVFMVTTSAEAFDAVREVLERTGAEIAEAHLIWDSTMTVSLAEDDARKVVRLIGQLEDHPDVQAVHTTLESEEGPSPVFEVP